MHPPTHQYIEIETYIQAYIQTDRQRKKERKRVMNESDKKYRNILMMLLLF